MPYIEDSINSFNNQTYKNKELIIKQNIAEINPIYLTKKQL